MTTVDVPIFKNRPDMSTPVDAAHLNAWGVAIKANADAAEAGEAGVGAQLLEWAVDTSDAAVAALTDDPASLTRAAGDAVWAPEGSAFADLSKYSGVDNTGATECAAALQAALNACGARGVRAYAKGTFKIASTVTIAVNADLGDALFNYTPGTGTAVRIGSVAGYIARIAVNAPKVVAVAKTVMGWAQVAGSIGVEVSNCQSSKIHVPYVNAFGVGLRVYGQNSKGCAYNTITIGHLDNNKVNQLLFADSGGWSNQNLYIGGRFSHNSPEGVLVAGTRHIQLAASAFMIDGNTWLAPSIESPDIVEYALDVEGVYNQWVNPRFENNYGPKVRWGATAAFNLISGGHGFLGLAETFVTGQQQNSFFGPGLSRLMASSGKGGLILENGDAATAAALTVMQPGGTAAGDVPDTDYGARLEYDYLRLKKAADTYPRAIVDGFNGRLYLGNGTVDPTKYFAHLSTSAIGLYGAHFYMGSDNVVDIGAATSYRPRSVHAGTSTSIAGITTTYGAAAPTTGAHVVGDEQKNSVPSVGAPKAWLCTVAGTPGTWVSTGNL